MTSEKEIALSLISEARKITAKTNQKEICNLVSKVCIEKFNHPSYKSLTKLQKALSNALTGQINNSTQWTSKLADDLDQIVSYYL